MFIASNTVFADKNGFFFIKKKTIIKIKSYRERERETDDRDSQTDGRTQTAGRTDRQTEHKHRLKEKEKYFVKFSN